MNAFRDNEISGCEYPPEGKWYHPPMPQTPTAPIYQRILSVIRRVPYGQVATYGQIALIVGDCTPRMVGYCLASLDFDSDVPWHRIINHRGMVSPRSTGHGSQLQRELLEDEGIRFDDKGRVSFRKHGWMEV